MCIFSMDIGKVIKPAEFIDFSKGKITHFLGSVKQKCLRSVVFNLCSGHLKFPGMKNGQASRTFTFSHLHIGVP